MLGKPSSRVVPIVHCTRAPSQRVKWGQDPTLSLSGRRRCWPGWREAFFKCLHRHCRFTKLCTHAQSSSAPGWAPFPNLHNSTIWANGGPNACSLVLRVHQTVSWTRKPSWPQELRRSQRSLKARTLMAQDDFSVHMTTRVRSSFP